MRLPIALATLALVAASCGRTDSPPGPPEYPGQFAWRGEGPDFLTGDVSPDGRYFTDINWDTGDLDVVDLDTGEARPLTRSGYDADRYAWSSSFSSDPSRIAVAWFEYETGTYSVRIESFDGSTSRVLIPAGATEAGWVQPLDWTPDDRFLVVEINRPGSDRQLGLVSVGDGSLQVLQTLGWEAPGGAHPQAYPRARVSPEGDLVAFDYPSDVGDNRRDVYAVAVDGGTMTTLVTGPGDDRLAAWTRDGSAVLVYSDRSGQPALWRQPLEDGTAAGPPSLVADAVPGIHPIAMTSRGLAFGVSEGPRNTYLAAVDFTTGEVTTPPRPVDPQWSNRNHLGDWSPDGSSLLYLSFGTLPDSTEYAVRVSPEGEALSRVRFPRDWHNETSGRTSWIADDFVLVYGNLRAPPGLARFDPRSGTIATLPDYEAQGPLGALRAAPDGEEFYAVVGGRSIVGVDARTGARRVIADDVGVNAATLAISPSGDALAYLTAQGPGRPGAIEVLDVATGERRPIPAEVNGRFERPMAWTADGERIVVGLVRDAPSDEDSGLVSVPLDGSSPPVFIALPDAVGDSNFMRISPDGEHLAYQGGIAYGSLRFLEVE